MTQNKLSYILALSAVLLWSTVATAFKITLEYLKPEELLFYGSSFSFLTYVIYNIFSKKIKLISELKAKDYAYSALLGFLNPFLYYLMLFKAYSMLQAQTALILNYSWAIVLTLMSAVFLKQKLKLYNFAAILVSFISLAFVAFKGDFTKFQFSEPFGMLIAVSTSFVWSSFFILNVKDKMDSSIRLMLNFAFGLIFSLVYILLFSSFSILNYKALLGSAYVGLFEMGITFLLWLNALKMTKNTALIGNLIFLSPILSLMLIAIILKEPIYISSIIGLSCIIISIIVQNILDYKRK